MANSASFSGRVPTASSSQTHNRQAYSLPRQGPAHCRHSSAPVLLQPQRPHRSEGRRRQLAPRSYAGLAEAPLPELKGPDKVSDVMTKGRIYSARVDTPIDEALELMVHHHITGLPVLDEQQRVVGVVSDYDLLSLDAVSGKMQETGFFPRADTNWEAFHEVQKLVLKNAGRVVGDVMTEAPLVVRPSTDMTSAARMLLESRVRRLPVVDDDGRLVGIFTRGDVIKAALTARRAAAASAFKN